MILELATIRGGSLLNSFSTSVKRLSVKNVSRQQKSFQFESNFLRHIWNFDGRKDESKLVAAYIMLHCSWTAPKHKHLKRSYEINLSAFPENFRFINFTPALPLNIKGIWSAFIFPQFLTEVRCRDNELDSISSSSCVRHNAIKYRSEAFCISLDFHHNELKFKHTKFSILLFIIEAHRISIWWREKWNGYGKVLTCKVYVYQIVLQLSFLYSGETFRSWEIEFMETDGQRTGRVLE